MGLTSKGVDFQGLTAKGVDCQGGLTFRGLTAKGGLATMARHDIHCTTLTCCSLLPYFTP